MRTSREPKYTRETNQPFYSQESELKSQVRTRKSLIAQENPANAGGDGNGKFNKRVPVTNPGGISSPRNGINAMMPSHEVKKFNQNKKNSEHPN